MYLKKCKNVFFNMLIYRKSDTIIYKQAG